ncbi:hypothetical protein SPSF3K_01527 [Streptococcus parauberis]|uniref:hypothetical protein n=1 Tax=Streptococcus parauberis TaxID=1348 RepID=UPI0003075DC2|nr:hypothetical protein [Streptococcus parauberis]AUT06251.1 hypothetical protein SPSF3K_01527 [Streptococcus parauberis]QBX17965.1 hypothetical protein Javan389_0006 [Streptococcus phage Javan389]UWV09642.1 hypothetical protein N2A95_07645 [Streptococcus parauberis]WEM62024.1 hypothetical protein P1T46_03465 [Streptococcus parauberis]
MTKLLKEIRDLLKEILAELKQQKEPIDLTIDSEKLAKSLNLDDLTEMPARLNSISNQMQGNFMKENDVIKTENLALKRENTRLKIVVEYLDSMLINELHSKSSIEIDKIIHDCKDDNNTNNHQIYNHLDSIRTFDE